MSTETPDPKAIRKYLRNILKDELDAVNIKLAQGKYAEELKAQRGYKRKVKAALKELAAGTE